MKAKSVLFFLLIALALGFSLTGLHLAEASAADLRSAKAAGYVGEQPNGYLGIVPGAPGDVPGLVADINQQRRAAYQNIAQSNGTSLGTVEQLAGRKAIEKTPAGQFVQSPSGQWVRK
ncbi:MAG: DUF1318 domain-containing protein [Zetaproteobacteria bacterium CG06_land_8_20_14_3_00_59_53]|nr:MAG: hypothetical protein AUK36_04470 [Zetaproteobacteria bacterium CG2_30_59_37]PIO89330.1 MAG: hypothetical protein COX56_08270 [Zetaproteobacteria bacterium CG23_combo_of_CG06-09_8_20_14_all_59_86]PIQ65612.1 MAG: hypothetical protein COV97_02875 [Zetaproteobacteria bacterium CG11_big_fil_rev_8_21_14_0_20_59_439]PIU70628.1 MAG: DUF1318 domain-containing protein [Zetaproteobacteria bacterium CG06_land_8_20_14_3_00_59_53]PIU98103.1 MAG: DUF1318 domain-containing protein [Zetaproteobacteria b